MGEAATRWFYVFLILLAGVVTIVLAVVAGPFTLLGLGAAPFGWMAIRPVRAGAQGQELIAVLGATGKFQLVYWVLLAIGIAIAVAVA
jgi:1,4-dihydroxy-2-naphthoate octaprenyltransferase